MPSTRNPNDVVLPGPGRLPAASVPASALLFLSGGGGSGDAALQAHITNPTDAHMSSAIGIPAYDPNTGEPLLAIVGGPIDGESVFDFIAEYKDLIPYRPWGIGFGTDFPTMFSVPVVGPPVPNTGVPVWFPNDDPVTGGFSRGTDVIFSHYIFPVTTGGEFVFGNFGPADRGIVSYYYSSDSDFFNAGTTTLVGAVWLGATANIPPAITPGIAPGELPTADFQETSRTGAQLDYGASFNPGTYDWVSVINRQPYLKDYSALGSVYDPYDNNFYRFQIAQFGGIANFPAADAGGWLLVHWRESFVASMADIDPANLNIGTLVAGNCYSAVPTAGDFDDSTAAIFNINRRNNYTDVNSGVSPSGVTWTSAPAGGATNFLSGMEFYDATLSFNMLVEVQDLFNMAYYTGPVASPPLLPNGFESTAPFTLNFGQFGASDQSYNYYELTDAGGTPFTDVNAPQPADHGKIVVLGYTPSSITSAFPMNGGQIVADLQKPNASPVAFSDTFRYLFNNYTLTGVGSTTSTSTYEPFNDEFYRYVSGYPTVDPSARIVPVGPDVFDSTLVFTSGQFDAQVMGSALIYPQTDFSLGAGYRPGGPDYAAVAAGDPAGQLRGYVRAFDTGLARNTGRIRIRGLNFSDFQATPAFTGDPVTDHPGGACIIISVPGATGVLDLGRPNGDPDMDKTVDFHGCMVGYDVDGSDLIVSYNTGFFTADNGIGEFPLFIQIIYLNGPGPGPAPSFVLDEIEWLAQL